MNILIAVAIVLLLLEGGLAYKKYVYERLTEYIPQRDPASEMRAYSVISPRNKGIHN